MFSPYQDGYCLIKKVNNYENSTDKPILIHLQLKTEMCWAINRALRKKYNKARVHDLRFKGYVISLTNRYNRFHRKKLKGSYFGPQKSRFTSNLKTSSRSRSKPPDFYKLEGGKKSPHEKSSSKEGVVEGLSRTKLRVLTLQTVSYTHLTLPTKA